MHQTPLSPTAIPTDSKIFGYGPMLPFVIGAVGCWFTPSLRDAAIGLTIIWGSLILAFLGGVRRGFGFGNPGASTKSEILTMMVYVSIGGGASILAALTLTISAVALLAVGYVVVPIADYRASKSGNAPAYFASLRPRQMSIAVISLIAILFEMLAR